MPDEVVDPAQIERLRRHQRRINTLRKELNDEIAARDAELQGAAPVVYALGPSEFARQVGEDLGESTVRSVTKVQVRQLRAADPSRKAGADT